MGSTEPKETQALLVRAFDLCRALEIEKVLVQLEALSDPLRVSQHRVTERIAWLTMGDYKLPAEDAKRDIVLHVPENPLTRMSQMRVGIFLALTQGFLSVNENVLCLLGGVGSRRLDTLMVLNPSRDFPWLKSHADALLKIPHSLRVIERVINCALKLAHEGREGRPIGTIFVVGNLEELKPFTHQLILNPLAGHPKTARSIHNSDFFETLRELAALDGAFLVDVHGTVESAGTFLSVATESLPSRPGLGARHAAAAALTGKVEGTLAVAISESSGTVTVYQAGAELLKLEKMPPEPGNRRLRRPRAK